jgi:N-acetylglucosaminyldiphosphoundecaprenol N-acetyl-beta-D-mannosaminyltransferase
LNRANVLGIGVHAVNLSLAAETIESALRANRRGYVCVTGVHGVMEAQRNGRFRSILDHAMLVVPDGVPTVWVGRWEGHEKMGRVFGPDLMSEVCRRSLKSGHTHYLYGGKPGIAEELKQTLIKRYPGIRIAGTYTPPFRSLSVDEKTELQTELSNLDPDIIWIGLSTPKQEQFMAENLASLTCRLMIGVGAAFDIHTGHLKDAPSWVKVLGMQWFHRLCQEPTRLWKRYLVNNSGFVVRAFLQLTGIKRYPMTSPNGFTE